MGFYAEWIAPRLFERSLNNPELDAVRAAVLADVSGDVLEIGFGSGSNLPHYPAHVKQLAAVEPSGGMTKQAQRRVTEWGGTLDLRHLAGEQLPFGDAAFDAVVITLTLCTVHDMDSVLSETRRVLRPGGRLYFLEHVASADPKARRWQERLNGLNRIIACGCNLNRDAGGAIRRAGFTVQDVQQAAAPGPAWFVPLVPTIRGVALKPA